MSVSGSEPYLRRTLRFPRAPSGTPAFAAVGVLVALIVGLMVPTRPQLALAFALALAGAASLAAPASVWIGAALVATVTFKGLSDIGLLPSIATFADIFLVWGGLATAALRARATSRRTDARAKPMLVLLAALALSAAISAFFSGSELLRPVVYFMLLGLPFALVVALLLDPPSPRAWRMLSRLVIAAALIQIPFAAIQVLHGASTDEVQGTLVGAGAGAHVMSAIAVIGALWLVAGEGRRSLRPALAGALLVLPFVADAKQVILAAPVMVLAGSWQGVRDVAARIAVAVAAVAVLFVYVPAGESAANFLRSNEEGRGGKQATAKVVLDAAGDDPARIVFGLGPAESVSRAAFMTTPSLLRADSPLHVLGLSPAALPRVAQVSATQVSGGETSLNSGVSSALGVFGDLGIVGAAVYAGLVGVLWTMLRRQRTPRATAAACALAVFAVLGVVFDWWEQPPFTLFVALLGALALVEPRVATGKASGTFAQRN